MTDPELHAIARQALNMARTDLELGVWETGIVLAWYRVSQDPPLHRMRMIERLLRKRLGEDWLNDEGGKDQGFHAIRLAAAVLPADAIVICTRANTFASTKKYMALPLAERKSRMDDRTPESRRRMVAEGLLEMKDAITAWAQTRERACVVSQPVKRGAFDGAAQVLFFPQTGIDGKVKMFGDFLSEKEKEDVARFRAMLVGLGIDRAAQ